MADVIEDAEFLSVLAMVAIGGFIVYLAYEAFQNASCITKVGMIPGVTGATKAQVDSAKNTANILQPGGQTIWSSGSDYDYQQPNGDVVQVRHSILGQLFGEPETFTTVPKSCYTIPCAPMCTTVVCYGAG